ncbi:tRNA (guanosine(37)-N1)-methyltransferase TrmD [bacterium]|nr:tRNA (guanosine(37)-N1)-methyltransferase TrmD [bacterium]
MRINILTLFPEYFECPLSLSMLRKAQKIGAVKFKIYPLREFGLGKRKQVDDRPYGGGAGMILRVDVMVKAIRHIKKEDPRTRLILLSPKGKIFNQEEAERLASLKSITLICGHYEGVDERVRDYVDEELSVGEYILTGGEPAALVIADAVVRLLPKVLSKEEAPEEESFVLKDKKGRRLLEYPHYTRPPVFEGKKVPAVLLSGNHQKIREWRMREAKKITSERKKNRP